jgi:hypothetical protein
VGGLVIDRRCQQKLSKFIGIVGREAEHSRKYPGLMFTSGVIWIQAITDAFVHQQLRYHRRVASYQLQRIIGVRVNF